MNNYINNNKADNLSFFINAKNASNCGCCNKKRFIIEHWDTPKASQFIGREIACNTETSNIQVYNYKSSHALLLPTKTISTFAANLYILHNGSFVKEKSIRLEYLIQDERIKIMFHNFDNKNLGTILLGINGNPVSEARLTWDDTWNNCMTAEVESFPGPATSVKWVLSGDIFFTTFDCIGVASGWW